MCLIAQASDRRFSLIMDQYQIDKGIRPPQEGCRIMEGKSLLRPIPFSRDSTRPSVFWASGDGPYDNTRKALSNIDLSPARGKRVDTRSRTEKGISTSSTERGAGSSLIFRLSTGAYGPFPHPALSTASFCYITGTTPPLPGRSRPTRGCLFGWGNGHRYPLKSM